MVEVVFFVCPLLMYGSNCLKIIWQMMTTLIFLYAKGGNLEPGKSLPYPHPIPPKQTAIKESQF